MTERDFFRMRWLIRRLPKLQWDIARKQATATKVTTVITGMPRGGGENRQEDAMIMLAIARDAYREAIEELEAMREQLSPKIDRLEDPDEKAAMRMRYLHGLSPEEIAQTIHRTDRSVYVYLNRAERRIIRMEADDGR